MAKNRVTTKTGDKGTTAINGGRVSKIDPIILMVGAIDELSSVIGVAKIGSGDRRELEAIQHDLYVMMAEMTGYTPKEPLNEERLKHIEERIDALGDSLPPIGGFVLPEGHVDLARAVSRRAEREYLALTDESNRNDLYARYFNRLSDYLFMLGR